MFKKLKAKILAAILVAGFSWLGVDSLTSGPVVDKLIDKHYPTIYYTGTR